MSGYQTPPRWETSAPADEHSVRKLKSKLESFHKRKQEEEETEFEETIPDVVMEMMLSCLDYIDQRILPNNERVKTDQWKVALSQYQAVIGLEDLRLGAHIRFISMHRNLGYHLNRGGTLLRVDTFDEKVCLTLKMYTFIGGGKQVLNKYFLSEGFFFQKITEQIRAVLNVK